MEAVKIKNFPCLAVWEMHYYLEHFLPLVNIYCENFLKDSTIIAIMSLENKEGFECAIKLQFRFFWIRRKITVSIFADNLIRNLHKFFDSSYTASTDKTLPIRIQNIAKLVKYSGIIL